MLIRKAVRYRLETTPEQENLLARAVGCVRFVWNRALAVQKSYLDHHCGTLNYAGLCELLTSWRNSEAFGFLAESPSRGLKSNGTKTYAKAIHPAPKAALVV